MQAHIVDPGDGKPVRLEAKRKPRIGGKTLGEFSNKDGKGVESAVSHAAEKGHDIWKKEK